MFHKLLGAMARVAFRASPRALHFAVRDRLPPHAQKWLLSLLGDRDIRQFQSYLTAQSLERKLWGGFSETALTALEAMKRHPATRHREVHEAAWALARWYSVQEDIRQAYENVVLMRLLAGVGKLDLRQILLEVECLRQLGQSDLARSILNPLLRKHPHNPELVLVMANSYAPILGEDHPDYDDIRLDFINSLYRAAGLVPIQKLDSSKPLSITNLTTPVTPASFSGLAQPRVSVIIPAFNASATLSTALDSLLRQSWGNLELIVVDDCSMDETFSIAQRYASHDSRIRVLRQDTNRGTYAARNLGLAHARGEFITTHDADDWSHPEKIAAQAQALMKRPSCPGNTSQCVRVDDSFCFFGTFRPSGRMMIRNVSSLMLRRKTFEHLGGWDEVRVSADTELYNRLEYHYGGRRINQVHIRVPISFVRKNQSSLTGQSRTHIRTLYHGVRRDYQAAARNWLMRRNPLDVNIHPDSGKRLFPAPGLIRAIKEEMLQFDLVFVMDFSVIGDAYFSTLNYVDAAVAHGLRVGLFHWQGFDIDVMQALRPEIMQLAQEGTVKLIAPGEVVKVDAVIVGYPVILKHPIDLAPRFEADKFFIIVNQMASRLYNGGDVQYDPDAVERNVRQLFGMTPRWIPISGLVRRLMLADGRYQSVLPWIWNPLIDTDSWCAGELRWRVNTRRRPVIGRHTCDHYTKWPSDADALRSAYCADRPCEVRLLGGIRFALDIIKKAPGNWRAHAFGSLEPVQFLRDLDFFVHYPHEDCIEAFGRAIIEAMAVGIPVILPPSFADTFGDAACYAMPKDVWSTVLALWRDQKTYLEQARKGRLFVMEHCAWGQLAERIAQAGILKVSQLQ